MDGTLTIETCWTIKEALQATPNKKIIDKVNKLSENNFIIIYTARRDFMMSATTTWLKKHDVIYHAISNLKIPSDWYVDDKAITPKDFLKKPIGNKKYRRP